MSSQTVGNIQMSLSEIGHKMAWNYEEHEEHEEHDIFKPCNCVPLDVQTLMLMVNLFFAGTG